MRLEIERVTTDVRVGGEVANVRELSTGHLYFTLRDEDEDASIECVLYRTAPIATRGLMVNGARIVVVGRATFWAPRGRVQLIVGAARLAGRGALLAALERRRNALAAEGLFAVERKRPLPKDPRVIGIVTSDRGAALHDILKVAATRGHVRFVVSSAPVQGAGAAVALTRALQLLARHSEVHAIILARGGGSNDDLNAFNEEVLVRAVVACRVPVVSAVGHETDVTLCDLAADVRAATPSQAAELLVPDLRARRQVLKHLANRLLQAHRRHFDERRGRCDALTQELRGAVSRGLSLRRDRVAALDRRVSARHPAAVLSAARAGLEPLEQRLNRAMRRCLEQQRAVLTQESRIVEQAKERIAIEQARLGAMCAQLDALSPLAVLGRGYGLVQRTRDAAIVRSPEDVREEECIDVRLARGGIRARVVT